MVFNALITAPSFIAWRARKANLSGMFLPAVFLLVISWNFGGDYYSGKWLGFGALCLLITGYEIRKKYGTIAAATLTYFLGSSLWFLVYSISKYKNLSQTDLLAFNLFCLFVSESALKLYLILTPFLMWKVDNRDLLKFGGWLSASFLVVSLGQIFAEALMRGCAGENSCGGALGNPSMNASMMAVCLPFAFKYFGKARYLLLAATIAGIILGRSNAGLGLVGVFLFLHLFTMKRWWILAGIPALAIIGWQFLGTKFLSSGDRVLMWTFFMGKWFSNPANWFFGTGFGSFGAISLGLQGYFQVRDGAWWIWMHNDWLQMIFETGLLGIVFAGAMYLSSVQELFKKGLRTEAQALILFGAAMCMNYLLHVALPCVFLAWILRVALLEEEPHGRRNRLDTGIN